jgi:hypothetical protein
LVKVLQDKEPGMPEQKMSQETAEGIDEDLIEVDLKNPSLAAGLGWFWPGAGHLYQGRYAKGVLFMVCILSTYLFGLAIGGGRVVYASWTPADRRWQYLCQVGAGAVALPALVQSRRVKNGQEPFWDGWMAPPVSDQFGDAEAVDELSSLHFQYHAYFELGTLYTMIAGLLNLLAVYDAYAGPVMVIRSEDPAKKPPDESS